jgi:hypothetical protein
MSVPDEAGSPVIADGPEPPEVVNGSCHERRWIRPRRLRVDEVVIGSGKQHGDRVGIALDDVFAGHEVGVRLDRRAVDDVPPAVGVVGGDLGGGELHDVVQAEGLLRRLTLLAMFDLVAQHAGEVAELDRASSSMSS